MKASDPSALRWFFCLPLASHDQASLARLQKASSVRLRWADARWAHVTLRFCGPLPQNVSESLVEKVTSGKGNWPPAFSLRGQGKISRLGRDAWALHLDNPPQLNGLLAALTDLCSQAGLPPERRPFLPHITLGRGAGPRPGDSLASFGHWGFDASALELRTSLLTPQGARYRVAARMELASSTDL